MVQAIYIFITYNLCTTFVYTALNLPYSSMAPMMTNDDGDLAKLNLFRMSMSPIGNMIVTACTLPFTTRLGAALHNKYFIMLTLTMITVSLYQNVNGTCSTYYAQYVLGNAELMGIMQTVEKILWILGVIFLAPFISRFGKRNMVLAGAVLCAAAQVLLIAAPANYMLVLVAAALRGLGEAPFYGCIFTMLADTIEFGHWKTNIRVHALLFSAFMVGQKFGGGIAGWASGQLMDASGFTGLAVEIPSAGISAGSCCTSRMACGNRAPACWY